MWKRERKETRKTISLFSTTPPLQKVLERSVPTWVINILHGLSNSSITSSNNYWWVLTKVYFCVWSSVGWDLGVGMARRSLTENGDYILNFLAEDSSTSDYWCSGVELALPWRELLPWKSRICAALAVKMTRAQKPREGDSWFER